jgi:hypothetical protein
MIDHGSSMWKLWTIAEERKAMRSRLPAIHPGKFLYRIYSTAGYNIAHVELDRPKRRPRSRLF